MSIKSTINENKPVQTLVLSALNDFTFGVIRSFDATISFCNLHHLVSVLILLSVDR